MRFCPFLRPLRALIIHSDLVHDSSVLRVAFGGHWRPFWTILGSYTMRKSDPEYGSGAVLSAFLPFLRPLKAFLRPLSYTVTQYMTLVYSGWPLGAIVGHFGVIQDEKIGP